MMLFGQSRRIRRCACALLAMLLLLLPAARVQPLAIAQSAGGTIVEPDDGRGPVLDFIASARLSVDLAIYELTDRRTVTALEGVAARGVRVRVLAEPAPGGRAANARSVAELAQHGVQTRDSSPVFRLTHEKTLVVDGATAVIMSLNLVAPTFDETRDVGIFDSDPNDIAEIEAVFQADWDRQPVAVSDPALVWSPDNARVRLLGLINGAASTLDIYAEELTDRDVLPALSGALAGGVRVRLLMTDTGSHDPARSGRMLLLSQGAEVRLIQKPFIHAKVIVADGTVAFAGSENLTAASLDSNRELGILSTDPVVIGRLSSTFEQDWQRASPAPRP